MDRDKNSILKPGIVTALPILLILLNIFFIRADSSAAPCAYITNHGSNSVSVIDTATDFVTDPLKYSTIDGSLTVTNGGISIGNIIVQ